VSTIAGSLNNATLSAEVSEALANSQILQDNVPAAAMDRCFTNSASANEMNDSAAVAGKYARLISFCMSHMICNAGDKAEFLLLELFWTHIQKVFATSQQARDEWTRHTCMAWPTYSETRWFSKYDVLEKLSTLFPDLLTVITSVVAKGISPANSTKLLNLLLDPLKSSVTWVDQHLSVTAVLVIVAEITASFLTIKQAKIRLSPFAVLCSATYQMNHLDFLSLTQADACVKNV
jgi:hypothetical protein